MGPASTLLTVPAVSVQPISLREILAFLVFPYFHSVKIAHQQFVQPASRVSLLIQTPNANAREVRLLIINASMLQAAMLLLNIEINRIAPNVTRVPSSSTLQPSFVTVGTAFC